jgi:hypothetical protein
VTALHADIAVTSPPIVNDNGVDAESLLRGVGDSMLT